MIDVKNIKQDFAIFKNSPELIYLDSAATSLKPDVVVQAMTEYYQKYPFAINRGSYKQSLLPTQKYKETKELLAQFLNATTQEIIFTKSTTAALNLLPHALEHLFVPGDEIIVSNMEHHANFLPWQILTQRLGLKLKIIKAKEQQILISDVKELITAKTKLIAIHHVSNVLGNTVDLKELCEYANQHKIITVIDGAQAVPHLKVDLQTINCDFYAFSGHKMLGPTGIGVLYINQRIQAQMKPLEYGGGMVVPSTVDEAKFTVQPGTLKFEAGTPAIAEVIGLGQAVKYLQNIGLENIHQHEIFLKKYALELLAKMKEMVEIYNSQLSNGLLVFNIKDVAVHDAVSASILNEVTFDKQNIIIRDGQHCNNLTMKYVLQQQAVLRASFYFYNTTDDVKQLVQTIKAIYEAWH